MRPSAPGDGLWRPGDNQTSALVSAFRPKVEHPIGAFDNIEVVLDHQHRVPRLDQTLQAIEQSLYVSQVQAGCRFVKNVKIMAAAPYLAQLSR